MATAIARTPDSAAPIDAETKRVNRREFLQYVWGASIALLLTESCGAITWFALPHYRDLSELGLFRIELGRIPPAGSTPFDWHEGKFFLINMAGGLSVLSALCNREGCYIKWVSHFNRFICPCCGTNFAPDGTKIYGSARRNLDRLIVNITTPNGTFTTPPDGAPVTIQNATQVIVDTKHKILGKLRDTNPPQHTVDLFY